jgi:hypothetical protein
MPLFHQNGPLRGQRTHRKPGASVERSEKADFSGDQQQDGAGHPGIISLERQELPGRIGQHQAQGR